MLRFIRQGPDEPEGEAGPDNTPTTAPAAAY